MKKLSIVVALALVVALAVPAMAASKLDVTGNLEMENAYTDEGGATDSSSYGDLDLFLNADIAENVSMFTELDYKFINKDTDNNDVLNGRIDEMWIDVQDAVGPLALRVGRMDEAAASNLLYDIEGTMNEFVRVAYDENNVSGKLGYNLDNTDSQKALIAEGKVTDLGLVNAVTVNYFDANSLAYEGYTLQLDKSHSFGDATLVFGEADNSGVTGASVLDVVFSTDTLFPGATASLEYGTAENGFVLPDTGTTKALQDDSVFNDAHISAGLNDEVQVIKPGINFDLTSKLNVDFSYAMFEADKADEQDDYLDLVASYDLAENTYLDVEYENHSVDIGSSSSDVDVLTTTLGVNF